MMKSIDEKLINYYKLMYDWPKLTILCNRDAFKWKSCTQLMDSLVFQTISTHKVVVTSTEGRSYELLSWIWLMWSSGTVMSSDALFTVSNTNMTDLQTEISTLIHFWCGIKRVNRDKIKLFLLSPHVYENNLNQVREWRTPPQAMSTSILRGNY